MWSLDIQYYDYRAAIVKVAMPEFFGPGIHTNMCRNFPEPSDPVLRRVGTPWNSPPEPKPTHIGAFRNIPPEPTPPDIGNLQNLPEPSGASRRNLHCDTPEPRNSGATYLPENSGTSLRILTATRRNFLEPAPGTFQNLPPEPAAAIRAKTLRMLSGLKAPLHYAVGGIFLTYGPRKAVTEVSNHNEFTRRKWESQLDWKSMDFLFNYFVLNGLTE